MSQPPGKGPEDMKVFLDWYPDRQLPVNPVYMWMDAKDFTILEIRD